MDDKKADSSTGKSPTTNEKGCTPNGHVAVDNTDPKEAAVSSKDMLAAIKPDEHSDDDYKSCEGEEDKEESITSTHTPSDVPSANGNSDDAHLDPRNQKWSEALKAKLFASADKESNYFSYMFLDKIFGEARPCRFCGARGTAKLPPKDDSLKLCVLEDGIVGRQNILCNRCGEIDTVISCDDPKRFPSDERLTITGSEIRAYCRNITHYEILHDLMEMLHIAATDDDSQRQEKHHEVADFMLKNVRKVCEEWCKPEYAELRLKKYLRLRDETLLTTYNPIFTPDCTEDYKEMYEMMANSFRQNRIKVLRLLQLMKESLIDSPTRSTFMMWVSIAMMHSESYTQFKMAYDPRSFMRVDSSEYQALQDRYLALEVPMGIKKIPVIFILFEIPRFYHYVVFLSQRFGKKKSRNYLTDAERASLKSIEEEATRMGLKMKPRTGKMVSPEAHLDFLTRQEEYGREMIYQSCRDKEKAKQQKMQNALKAATSVKGKHPSSSTEPREGSLSPSTTKKSESSKSSSSKDSTLQASKTSSSSSATVGSSGGGADEKGKHTNSQTGTESSKSVRNKKKKKKLKVSSSEAESSASLLEEEEIKKKKKKVEEKKERDEFISNDALHSILRETLAEHEAMDAKTRQEEEDRIDEIMTRRFRVIKRELQEELGKKSPRKKRHAKKEEKLKSSKVEEKKLLRDEERKECEKKSLKKEEEKLDEKLGSEDGSLKEEEKKVSNKKEKEPAPSKEEDKSTSKELVQEVQSAEVEKKTEKEKKQCEEGQTPKAIKPEVNPDSPLANVSFPPRPGLDLNRKPLSLPSMEPTTTPTSKYTTRSSLKKELREQKKAHKRHKKSGRDSRSVLCAQVDTEMLRAQGYKVSGDSPVTTVIANGDGTIEHILEGLNTPEQVKAFLSRRYSILNQQAGSGYLTMPSKNDPGAIVVDQSSNIHPSNCKFDDIGSEPKPVGNPKKRKKAKLAQHNPAISSLMDCFAQQRQQSQGGWRSAVVQQQQEMVAGVMDEEMCGMLGGGDLTKALSTAYDTVMARADDDEKSGSVSSGLPGINSYRINNDGPVREEDMSSDSSPVPTGLDAGDHVTLGSDRSGCGSTSSTDSEKNGSGSSKDDKSGSGSAKDEKNDKKEDDSKSGSGSIMDEESGSGDVISVVMYDKSRSGSAKDEKSGSGIAKFDEGESGSSKDEKITDDSKDDKVGSGSSKDDQSGSGRSKHKKGGRGKYELEKSDTKYEKSARDLIEAEREKRLALRFKNYQMVERELENDRVALISRKSRSLKNWKSRYPPLMKDKYCVANTDDLVPEGIISTAGWSRAKRDLFKNRMCRGLDEKVFTVDSEDEARAIFIQAMKPTDLGKLEGPCPRYVVPSAGGMGHLAGKFSLPDVGNIRDLDDFLRSPYAPRQQMTLLDAMNFPYKLETTKVYIKRKDKDGNELPNKVSMVSKVTLLPKELAGRYCAIGHPTPGSILELTDSEDVVEDSSDDDDILEIEAPPTQRDYPPHIVSSADILMDAPPEEAVRSLTKVITQTLASTKDKPVTIEKISESIMDCLKELPNTEIRPNTYDDSELAISLLNSSYETKIKDIKESAPKRRKIKKKAKKPKSVISRSIPELKPASRPITVDIADEDFHVVEMPSKSEMEEVRDIDDIDDIDIGASEDLLLGAGIGGGALSSSAATTPAAPAEDPSVAKTAQSKVAAREKFRTCDNCGSVIEDRILVCSSCKKVAYCNRKCQKSHWKSHKKTCSHKAPKEDCTG